jgi:hypothetical protein
VIAVATTKKISTSVEAAAKATAAEPPVREPVPTVRTDAAAATITVNVVPDTRVLNDSQVGHDGAVCRRGA